MMTKEDLKQEFDLFADIWKMFKALLPAGDQMDVEYWDTANQMVIDIMQKYPGEFSEELSLAVLSEIERRCGK